MNNLVRETEGRPQPAYPTEAGTHLSSICLEQKSFERQTMPLRGYIGLARAL